ncbi:T9SS type A sorting domain-containing protein [Ekhidna sp.]|uniref:T9SS type A sorting domain-containing protein n=1 Tax=Ekhidna sp. TaxID=2608089 RepID=UPI003B501C91
MTIRRSIFFIGIIFSFFSSDLHAQESLKLDKDKIQELIICHYYERDENVFIPNLNQSARSNTKQSSTIEVEYIGFTAEAKTAFQYAVDIWETLIISEIPIKIQANWAVLDQGVLGSAGPGLLFRDFNGAQHPNSWYPVALAEKLSGEELNNPDEFEIVAQFNRNISWYFGTDAQPPSGEFDLVSVVLHEIGHGLGFFTATDVESNQGSIGLSGFPFEFDWYMRNGNGQLLIDDDLFANPSVPLANQLTGGDLFFTSNIVSNVNAGIDAELYAPSVFDGGSSISHLDQSTFDNTINSLMTPAIGTAEANHNIGPVTTRLLAQLGWLRSRIDHDEIIDSENLNLPVNFEIAIVSDSNVVADSVFINIAFNDGEFSKIVMTDNGNNRFSYITDTIKEAVRVNYFFNIEDAIEKETFLGSEDIPLSFYVGVDTVKPTLIHDEIESVLSNEDVTIEVDASDNIGLDSVFVDFVLSPGDTVRLALDNTFQNLYSYVLAGDSTKDISTFFYRIGARDSSSQKNFAFLPSESEFYNVTVNSIAGAEEVFTEDFDSESTVISGDFNISLESGFTSKALHSDHPYANGTGEGFESDFITTLLKPIIVREGDGDIQFDEVVLVEPGAGGSVFGTEDFFDYVVVEGSSDEGLTWEALEDGYDSRRFSVWENRFNSNTDSDEGNSLSVGDATLYKKHKMSLLTTFNPGDEVLLRFRLHVDRFLTGWGWAIDNLVVQDLPLGLDAASRLSLTMYPNPFSRSFFIKSDSEINEINLYTVGGKFIEAIDFEKVDALSIKANTPNIDKGVFLIEVKTSKGSTFHRVAKD